MNRETYDVWCREKDGAECLSLFISYGSLLTPCAVAQDNGIGFAESMCCGKTEHASMTRT